MVTAEMPFAAAKDGLFLQAFRQDEPQRCPHRSGRFAYLVSRRRKVQGAASVRDMAIAVADLLFSLWVTFASGYQAVYQAMVLVLFGIPLYGFLKAR